MSTDHTDTVLAGRYRLLRRLGRGGFAEVWLARDLEFPKREVAVKILHPKFTADSITVGRFIEEAQIAGSINDPNDHIVKVHDYGDSDGHYFLVMEFLEGPTLREELTNRRPGVFECAEALHIVSQICDGLAAVRKRGVAHRDLKPENIFLVARRTDVHVKIVDLGIAKVVHEQELAGLYRKAPTGELIGTSVYMAPERVRQVVLREEFPAEVYYQSDVYSLGVILYEMLTGAPPFEGPDAEVLRLHLATVPLTPREVRPALEIPDAVEALVMRCLNKAPQQRYNDAGALGREIRRLLIDLLRDRRYTSIVEQVDEQAEPRRPLAGTEALDDAITKERPIGNVLPFPVTRPVPLVEEGLSAPEQAPIASPPKLHRAQRRTAPFTGARKGAPPRASRGVATAQAVAEVAPEPESRSMSSEISLPSPALPTRRDESARHPAVEVPAVTQIIFQSPPPIPFFIKVTLLVLSVTVLLSMAGMGYALHEVLRPKAGDDAPPIAPAAPIGDPSQPREATRAPSAPAAPASNVGRGDGGAVTDELVESGAPAPANAPTSMSPGTAEPAARPPSTEEAAGEASPAPKRGRTMKNQAARIARKITDLCKLNGLSKKPSARQCVVFDVDETGAVKDVSVREPVEVGSPACIRGLAKGVSFKGTIDLKPNYEHCYSIEK